MKIKHIIFSVISFLFFNVGSVFAAKTTNMCVYNGVSINSQLFTTASDTIRVGKDLVDEFKGKNGNSMELVIQPDLSSSGYVASLTFTDHNIASIGIKPVITGYLQNYTSFDYTDNWRSEKISTSTPVDYTSNAASEFMNYGFCPERVVIKVKRTNYAVVGGAVGGATGTAAVITAGALGCPAIGPFIGIDPITAGSICTTLGIATAPASTAAGTVYGVKVGEENTKWEITNMRFLNDPQVTDYINIPKLFDAIDNSHLIVGNLVSSSFNLNEQYTNFNSSTCFTKDDVDYYTKKFDDIINYSKNLSYITLYKNNKFENIATIVSKKYSEGGECYNSNSSLQSSYKSLSSKASKVLDIFGNAGKQNEKYKNECQYILGDPSHPGDFAYYLDITFRFIKFLAPILLIVLSIIDYVKVIASADADAVKKVNKKTVIRVIFALLLFLLPIIISTVLSLLGVQGKCDFPNINGL